MQENFKRFSWENRWSEEWKIKWMNFGWWLFFLWLWLYVFVLGIFGWDLIFLYISYHVRVLGDDVTHVQKNVLRPPTIRMGDAMRCTLFYTRTVNLAMELNLLNLACTSATRTRWANRQQQPNQKKNLRFYTTNSWHSVSERTMFLAGWSAGVSQQQQLVFRFCSFRTTQGKNDEIKSRQRLLSAFSWFVVDAMAHSCARGSCDSRWLVFPRRFVQPNVESYKFDNKFNVENFVVLMRER